MPLGKRTTIHRDLLSLFGEGTIGSLTDGQLLERFATLPSEQGETSFSMLVTRHGPMVLRVCRSLLKDPNDVEDAFQATFIVLVKRAKRLWVRDSIGPWLHQVAYRTALQARASSARRKRLESKVERAIIVYDHSSEEGEILHEEINRLPEKFRAPIVLCDLEGRTHEQAARHLGWPVGSVKSRQARGRDRLKSQLVKRGFEPHYPTLALILPTPLVDTTARLATKFVHGKLAAESSAVILAWEVLHVINKTRFFMLASVLTVSTLTFSGISALAQRGDAKPEASPASNREVKKSDPHITERGNIESANRSYVYNKVEGQTTIIRIVPEGSYVKKGDLICELDAARLREQLLNQENSVRKATAGFEQAKLVREVAEIAKVEYEEGIASAENKVFQSEIDRARASITSATTRRERVLKAQSQLSELLKGRESAKNASEILAEIDLQDRLDSAGLTVKMDEDALAKATQKLENYVKYTKARLSRQLTIELEKARDTETASEVTLRLEDQRMAKFALMIEQCKLGAPSDGVVLYANDPTRPNRVSIEEGATVRERQIIFSTVDLKGPWQVNVKAWEGYVDRIVVGERAKITIDAFPGQTFTGVVKGVAPLPDLAVTNAPGNKKYYTTIVTIDRSSEGVRPGMTASVELVLSK